MGHCFNTSKSFSANSSLNSTQLNPSLSKLRFLVCSKASTIFSFYSSVRQSDRFRFLSSRQSTISLLSSSVASSRTKLSHRSNDVRDLQLSLRASNRGKSPSFRRVFWNTYSSLSLGTNLILLASSMMPPFSIRLRAIAKTSRLGVPSNPFAISVTPRVPSPQLLISRASKEVALERYVRRALAPKGLTALWLMSRCLRLVERRPFAM